jgi:hypothetical protein
MIRFDIPYVEADRTLTQAGYEVFSGQDRRIGAAEADIAVLEAADATEAANAPGSAPRYACRAWVNFNGTGTVAIRASGNVSSITDNGVGNYTVNFTTAMMDANYTAVVGAANAGVGLIANVNSANRNAGNCQIFPITDNAGAAVDAAVVELAVFR